MNKRALVVGGAVVAALLVALIVRSLLGGGTPKVEAAIPQPRVVTKEVLVAGSDLQPGTPLNVNSVRWQAWPSSAVDGSFITQDETPSLAEAVQGTVVRAPMVAGEPVTNTKIVHADSAGFMAATLAPGMRAISVAITTETGAGGFILPNDRVDVLLTQQNEGSQHSFRTRTVLSDVRVLAVDQTYKEDKDQKVVLAKTATLELTPAEAMTVQRAQASGTISLSLRPLVEGNARATADRQNTQADSDVTVIRYGHGDHKE
ncbi:MAG TPA: Flp pilus assembly protein CpaB [Rhizomicrobium sp.]|nr:Flp pilus assembly protein CpaB [Rhizomicrobium sp.]